MTPRYYDRVGAKSEIREAVLEAPISANKTGIFPRVFISGRWINLLMVLPTVAILLLFAVAAAILLRGLPAVQDFITVYSGQLPTESPHGFPWWLRWQHLLNVLFLVPIMRSGLQILAGRPRLYWRQPGIPGREWLRMQKKMPVTGGWSAKDDAVQLSGWVGLPGRRHSTGLARSWHLGVDMLWLVNGIVFYALLFSTGQWTRIVPTSWDVFPNALSTLLQYLSLDFPHHDSWVAYNGLQMLAYFVTVFIAAPAAILTGLLQSPAISRRLHAANSRVANVEVARSVHVLVLGWFIVFTVMHVTLVFSTGVLANLNHITIGHNDGSWAGVALFTVGVAVIAAVWVAATPVTVRRPQLIQRIGQTLLGPLKRLF